jgi:hypothetical protein
MNSIIELNKNEISVVSGGGQLGNWLGWIGSVAGAGIYALEQVRGNDKANIRDFYKPSLAHYFVIMTKASFTFMSIVGFQLGCSFVFATTGNIMDWFCEKIFWKTT